MSHIQDRWYNEVIGPDGKKSRVKTDLFGKGMRYKARYVDPAGKERAKSFPDKKKGEAEDFLIKMGHTIREQIYVSPHDGKIGFDEYARTYLVGRDIDVTTEVGAESRIKHHLIRYFGSRAISSIKPETVNEWNEWMKSQGYAEGTRALSFGTLKSILAMAKENGRIGKNPCDAKSVAVPRQSRSAVVPWPDTYVASMRKHLSTRYRAMVDVAAGCGLRQGEVFGLSFDDIESGPDGDVLQVRRQIKYVRGKVVFGLPKSDLSRTVPLPLGVKAALKAHLDAFPQRTVTLPWERPNAKETMTARLIFSTSLPSVLRASGFMGRHWTPALKRSGIKVCRENGMHALRHYYASVAIAEGEDIKTLSAYLGHKDPAFTWRTYVHLVPGRAGRTRSAIDAKYGSALTATHGLETA
jgi:integrase